MTLQPHDRFAKQCLEELLSPLGTVEISKEVTAELPLKTVYRLLSNPTPSQTGEYHL